MIEILFPPTRFVMSDRAQSILRRYVSTDMNIMTFQRLMENERNERGINKAQAIFTCVPETHPLTSSLLYVAVDSGMHMILDPKVWKLIETYYTTPVFINGLIPIAGTRYERGIKERILKSVEALRQAVIEDGALEDSRESLEKEFPPEAVRIKKVIRWKGKHLEETKKRIADSRRNRPLTEAHKQHMREARTGVPLPHTEAWNQAIKEGVLLYYKKHKRSARWAKKQGSSHSKSYWLKNK